MKIRYIVIFIILLFLGLFLSDSLKATSNSEKQKTEHNQSKPEDSSQTKSFPKKVLKEKKKYTGEPGTFIFQEADLKNVLLIFSKTYKLNMVIDPGINGKITIRLKDVPWDQALDLILKQGGLALIKEGKVYKTRKLPPIQRH